MTPVVQHGVVALVAAVASAPASVVPIPPGERDLPAIVADRPVLGRIDIQDSQAG
jgi:hypothetical protein